MGSKKGKKFFCCLIGISFLLFGFVSYSQNTKEPTTINWIPSSSKCLGQGIDLNNIDKWFPLAFTFTADTVKMGVSGETHFHVIETESDLYEALDFNAGIAARNLNFNIESKFGISKSTINNSFNLNIMLTAIEYYDLITIKPNSTKLSDRATTAINDRFKEFFGSYYIGAIRTGSKINLLLSIQAGSLEKRQALRASLTGSYKSGLFNASGYANFKNELNSFTSNNNINIDITYSGLQSNDSIKKIIYNFKQGNNTVKYDLESLMRSTSSLLSSMNRKNAAPLILSISPFSTLDSKIKDLDRININDDYLNFKLLKMQKEYFKTKNKLEQIFELLRMEDHNYRLFFYSDLKVKTHKASDTLSYTAAGDKLKMYNDTIPMLKFDSIKYHKYEKYSEYLGRSLDRLVSEHNNCISNCALASCCNSNYIFVDTFMIPEKYSQIICLKQIDPNGSIAYSYKDVLFENFEFHNLKKNSDIEVRYRFSGHTIAGCNQFKFVVSSNILVSNQPSPTSIPLVDFWNLSASFNYANSFSVKTDADGNLIFNLFNTSDYFGACSVNTTTLIFDENTFVEVRYKD